MKLSSSFFCFIGSSILGITLSSCVGYGTNQMKNNNQIIKTNSTTKQFDKSNVYISEGNYSAAAGKTPVKAGNIAILNLDKDQFAIVEIANNQSDPSLVTESKCFINALSPSCELVIRATQNAKPKEYKASVNLKIYKKIDDFNSELIFDSTNFTTIKYKIEPNVEGAKIIFYDMNDGKGYSANLGGVSGADKACKIAATNKKFHPNLPDNVEWKALIAEKNIRAPGFINESISPIDWSLKPDTFYKNELHEYIGKTNKDAIFYFPTYSSLYRGHATNLKYARQYNAWIGIHIFDGRWTASRNCSAWTNDSNYGFDANKYGELGAPSEAFARVGFYTMEDVDNTSQDQIHDAWFSTKRCNRDNQMTRDIYGILCVQQ